MTHTTARKAPPDSPANPVTIAGGDPQVDEYGPSRSASVVPFKPTPKDRLPGFWGAPPRLSLYHTERAQSARERAEAKVPAWLADARRILWDGGLRRADTRYADVADHNIMTLACALNYASHGFHVIDSHAVDPKTALGTGWAKGSTSAKIPRGTGWEKRASTDRDQIIRGWTGDGIYPVGRKGKPPKNYNKIWCPRNVSIAFPPGCDLFVVDVDGPLGLKNLAALEDEHGPLPKTVAQITGSGGRHYIFRGHGRPIFNSASAFATKIDIRGEGGQMLVCPSIHESGGFYQWLDGCSPDECEIAVAPEWLEQRAFEVSKKHQTESNPKPKKARQTPKGSYTAHGETAPQTFDERLASFGDGDGLTGFNTAIYAAACAWWWAFPEGDSDDLKDLLREAILDAPCDNDRAITRYATDYHLDSEIGNARVWVEGERQKKEDVEQTPEESASLRDRLLSQASTMSTDTTEPEILALIREAIADGADSTVQARLKGVVTAQTPLGADAFNRLWKAEAKLKPKEKAKLVGGIPVQSIHSDFSDQVDYAQARIVVANEESPCIFQFGGAYSVADSARNRVRLIESKDSLFTALHKITRWEKITDGDGAVQGVVPPELVVKGIFNDHEFADTLPEILAVPSTPFFDMDGNLVEEDGYHAGAKVYLAKGGLALDRVSGEPTPEEVKEAKRLLVEEVLADFPLGGMDRDQIVGTLAGESRDHAHAVTHAIAFMLLPFCRAMIAGPTPGHMFTKPGPGTGASLLVDLLTLIATGSPAPAMTFPTTNEEVGKTLSAALAEGAPFVLFDNIDKSIGSGELASAMTAQTYQARILGKSQTVTVPVRTVWTFTGNNITANSDVLRRLILILLDAGVPDPENRTPAKGWRHKNVRQWVSANRPMLVWACLTLIQNWVAKGMKRAETSLASYEDWAEVMGGILKAADFQGFLGGQAEERAKAIDSADDGLVQLLYVMAEFPDGTLFRAGGTRPLGKGKDAVPTVSIQALLNGTDRAEIKQGDEAPDPIQINGWGYSTFDGAYKTSGQIGARMKVFARKPYQVGDQLVSFEGMADPRDKTVIYRMTKTPDAEEGETPGPEVPEK